MILTKDANNIYTLYYKGTALYESDSYEEAKDILHEVTSLQTNHLYFGLTYAATK